MDHMNEAAGGPPAGQTATQSTRRRWLIAGGGTIAAVVVGAALMQVFRSGEGVAAEGRASVADGAAAAQVPAGKPQYLARVGSAVVTYDQVADEAMARYGGEVLDQLINRTIIEIACRDRGISVTEAEVEQEITTIAQEFGLDRSNWLQMLQAERNITPIQYKRDVIWPMIALKKLAGAEVQVTEADIKRAFERDYGPKVKARMIMMDNQRRLNEVWQKANAAREAAGDDQSKAAAEFGRLAREHSMEPTSKALDGVIPPIRRHTGPENESIENAAFNLRPGEISGIVQLSTPGAPRYVILFCEGHTEPVVTPDKMDLVRDEIVAQLTKEKTQESVAKVFKKLQEETPVHNFLTNTSTGAVQPAGGPAVPGNVRPTGAAAPASASNAGPARR